VITIPKQENMAGIRGILNLLLPLFCS